MLTVADLHREREARARVNHETYKQLHAQVQDRIRARAANKAVSLTWQVPPFVPGRPVYTVSHAARYVSDKLRRGGFDVTVIAPQPDVHVLIIAWDTAGAARKQQQRRVAADREAAREAPRADPLHDASRTLEKLKARLRVGR